MPRPTTPTLTPFTSQLPDVNNPATWAERTPLFWNWVTGPGYTNLDEFLTYSEGAIDFVDAALAGSETVVGAVATLQADVAALEESYIVSAAFVGAVMAFAMSTPPIGWLKANGAAVNRSTYSDLFAAIGTTFGAGDGTTTFNLPDLRGEFIRGWDDGRGVDSGRSFGSFQGHEFQSHTHTYTLSRAYDSLGNLATGRIGRGQAQEIETDRSGEINISGGSETRPRNRALLACIKF